MPPGRFLKQFRSIGERLRQQNPQKKFPKLKIVSIFVINNQLCIFFIKKKFPDGSIANFQVFFHFILFFYIQCILHIFLIRVVHTGLLHFELQAMR